MIKIAIFCGGPSSEHEVSLSSAQSILNHIDRTKYIPYIFFIKKTGEGAFFPATDTITPPKDAHFTTMANTLSTYASQFDVAFLGALHGEFGEDGTVQKLLTTHNISYTGSGANSSALCIDKYASMQAVKDIPEIVLPETIHTTLSKLQKEPPLPFPFVLKPNALGSSVFVFIIKSQEEYTNALKTCKQNGLTEVLVQEYISGVELSCGCLEKKDGSFIPLPPIEIRPRSSFFDYGAKYETGGSEEITPPTSISKELSKKLSEITISIHKALQCVTYSRSDFMYANNRFYYLETNTLPGMTATSLLPQEAAAAHISFPELIDFIISERP